MPVVASEGRNGCASWKVDSGKWKLESAILIVILILILQVLHIRDAIMQLGARYPSSPHDKARAKGKPDAKANAVSCSALLLRCFCSALLCSVLHYIAEMSRATLAAEQLVGSGGGGEERGGERGRGEALPKEL